MDEYKEQIREAHEQARKELTEHEVREVERELDEQILKARRANTPTIMSGSLEYVLHTYEVKPESLEESCSMYKRRYQSRTPLGALLHYIELHRTLKGAQKVVIEVDDTYGKSKYTHRVKKLVGKDESGLSRTYYFVVKIEGAI